MARLNPESSTTYLALDAAGMQTRKMAIDPTLIGVFDQALRRAELVDNSAEREAASAPEGKVATDTRPQNERADRGDREDRGSVDSAAEDVDRTSAPADEAPHREDEEPQRAESDEASETAEQAQGTQEEEVEDEPDVENETAEAEVAADAVVTKAVDPEAASETTGEETVKSESAESGSIDGRKEAALNRSDEAAPVPQATDSAHGSLADGEGAAVQVAGEAAVAAQGDAEEGEEDASLSQKSEVQAGKAGEAAEKPIVDATDEAANSATSGDVDEASLDEQVRTAQEEEKAKPRSRSGRDQERQGPVVRDDNPSVIHAEASRPDPAASTTPADPLQNIVRDATPPPVVESAGANISVAEPATQTSPIVENASTSESRLASVQTKAGTGLAAAKESADGVDPARFVQRVAKAISAMGQRTGPVRLKLYPPELGSLRMEISVKNGTLTAKVEAETGTAKSLLMDNLPVLRERLAEQGVKVDRFDVEVADQSQQGPSEGPNDGGHTPNQGRREAGGNTESVTEEHESSNRSDERQVAAGRLDVTI